MENNQTTSRELWRERLKMTQQLVFTGMKQIAQSSDDELLRATMNKQWFSGYDMSKQRMLPDGKMQIGAPFSVDISMRSEIVSEVLDGLKQRPRTGSTEAKSLYVLDMYEYDLLLAMSQVYYSAETLINAETIDPYQASSLETTVWTMLHVARCDDATITYKAMDETDYDACEI